MLAPDYHEHDKLTANDIDHPAALANIMGVSTPTTIHNRKLRDGLSVDTRWSDYTGRIIRGAMNLLAHSFCPTRKVLYDLCEQAGLRKVIFIVVSLLPSIRPFR